MADENVTVKASTEVKARYEELKSKSGLTSKDFFELVLSQHEISNIGKEVEHSLDLPQIRTHLTALEAIFLSQIQKSIDTNQFFNTKITQENDLHKTLVNELQQTKTAAITDRDAEEAKRLESDSLAVKLAARNEELELQRNTDKSTIANFTRRNDDLEAEKNENKRLTTENADQMKTMRSENHELENQINDVVKQNESMDRELKASMEKANKVQLEMNEKMASLIVGHEKDLAQLAKTTELLIANEKSESERRVLQEMQTLKDEMHKVIEEQHRENNIEKNEMHKTIETLNKRIFDLLETKKSQEVKTTKG